MSASPTFVYILHCADGTFYVGLTSDLCAREEQHNAGLGGAYTAARRPVRLVYSEECRSLADARKRELQIKRWSGKKKAALVSGNREELKRLSRRRT